MIVLGLALLFWLSLAGALYAGDLPDDPESDFDEDARPWDW